MTKPTDNNKTAAGYPPMDPYANYGQYGMDRHDDQGSILNPMLLAGGTALGAGLLHHGLMGSEGQFARAYQSNLGRAIREQANKARGAMGMEPVAQPAHPVIQQAKELAGRASAISKNLGAIAAPVAAAAGGVRHLVGKHQELMESPTNGGEMYRKFVANPAAAAAGAVRGGVERLKARVAPPSPEAVERAQPKIRPGEPKMQGYQRERPAPEPKAEPAAKAEPSGPMIQAKKAGPAVDVGKKKPSPKVEKKPSLPVKKASLEDFLLTPAR